MCSQHAAELTLILHDHVLVAAAHHQQGGILGHTKRGADLSIRPQRLCKGDLPQVPAGEGAAGMTERGVGFPACGWLGGLEDRRRAQSGRLTQLRCCIAAELHHSCLPACTCRREASRPSCNACTWQTAASPPERERLVQRARLPLIAQQQRADAPLAAAARAAGALPQEVGQLCLQHGAMGRRGGLCQSQGALAVHCGCPLNCAQ